ncbi:rhamnogalacturonan acetylesterase [Pedobacter fastidiosus]|uniref:Rhamnogalacturonan acetylesterase n=1 Tax=Pedobacter fastidiosus TaxID=2765361 RepID=A0ABR7KUZ9_9SPHI|nr:rhamnogalacturonan acetylesterase [Pedobacter fastidiosus]MBC6111744.1 rhamnogalacturonan acetylesterase [Pedobacter fastidiosus]
MKIIKSLFAIASIALLSFTFVQKKITVYIIGDSTAANKKPEAFPETGWGMELQAFFKSDVVVDNRALNGRSTKSFQTEKHWQPILDQLAPGDYVFIEFGHNDEKTDKPAIGTSLAEFKANLVKFVNETRSKKAFPVLLTPISRRSFKNGVLIDSHGDYPSVTRKVADSLKVPLIDMLIKTESLLNRMGDLPSIKLFNHVDSGNVNYPTGKKDDTHLSPEGAKQVAGLVVNGIKEQKLNLAKKLK